MTTRRNVLAAASGAAVAAAVVPGRAAAGGHQPSSWVGTWAAVPTAVPPSNITVLQDQTVRMVLHPSISGSELRVRLSNEFGEQPLAIAEAHIAHRAGTCQENNGGFDRQPNRQHSSQRFLPRQDFGCWQALRSQKHDDEQEQHHDRARIDCDLRHRDERSTQQQIEDRHCDEV